MAARFFESRDHEAVSHVVFLAAFLAVFQIVVSLAFPYVHEQVAWTGAGDAAVLFWAPVQVLVLAGAAAAVASVRFSPASDQAVILQVLHFSRDALFLSPP